MREAQTLSPTPPALAPSTMPPLAGRIGEAPEDFRVDERPLYEASGEGEHLYLHVEKRGLNTDDLVRRIAKAAGVSPRDVGYAGLKDRHAVTTQWLSVALPAPPEAWDLGEEARVLATARHTNKLRTGHLTGNRFAIRLVDLEDSAQLLERAAVLRQTGVLNGFDAQRFGREGRNLDRALQWVRGENRRVSPFQKKLYASVLQSQVFNEVLAARVRDEALHVLHGDVLRLNGSRSVFVSQEVEVDEARRSGGDVHLTGPIFGPKAPRAEHAAAVYEDAAIASLGLDDVATQHLGRAAPGTRRDLFLTLEHLEVDIESPNSATVRFELGAGAYATNVIRHLLRGPWSEDLRGSGGAE